MFYLLHKYLTAANKMTFEVVLVDDDDTSPDSTLAVAHSLQQSYGQELLQIMSPKAKLGLGTAYLAGLQASKGDRIILMDEDFLSHHPKFIPTMVEQIMNSTGVDIVTGTRYAPGGGVAG